jgi:hypothetical protein
MIKRVGTYGFILLLFAIVWKITSMIIFAMPSTAVEFCYRNLINGLGESLFIVAIVLQVGFILVMLGSHLWKRCKRRPSAHHEQA